MYHTARCGILDAMRPILFEIPTPWIKIPIYGFGLMLVIALFVSTWLACRRAQQEGIAKERIQDVLKQYEAKADEVAAAKTKEIME